MKRFALIVLVLLLISTLCGCSQRGNSAPEAATEEAFADTTPIAEATVETVPPYEYRHLYDDQEAMEAAELLCALGLFRATGTDLYARPVFDLEKPFSHSHAAFLEPSSYAEEEPMEARAYLAALVSALGYAPEDYASSDLWSFAKELGLTDERYDASVEFLQYGDAVVIAQNAIGMTCKDSEDVLLICLKDAVQLNVDFASLMEAFSAEHKAMVENDAALGESVQEYLVEDKQTVDLLTEEEIQELITPMSKPHYVTYEEAVYDVDVLFRAFRSAYGAYYYIGEDFFANAEAEILDWLEGQSNVNSAELEYQLGRIFSNLRDAHTRVQGAFQEQPLRYKYYYTNLEFAQDDNGYYMCAEGEKWYFDTFSDNRVTMEYRLSAAGEIVYSPVLFCLPAELEVSTVILKNTAGQTREEDLIWSLSQPYGESYRTPDFKLLEENGVAYISVRCFDPQYEKGELADFVASGAKVKDAELIIFDIRSNGGGNDSYGREWVKKYCGKEPVHASAWTKRISQLRKEYVVFSGFFPERGTNGTYELRITKGKQLKNETPIIVLVDDTCGSAGESMLNDLRSLDNVMIIGSNSAGYQLCGNQVRLFLPNSNIECDFGTSLFFVFTGENVDYKGYTPDVWCNPKDALDAVINMLLRYDLTDISTWQSLKANLAK